MVLVSAVMVLSLGSAPSVARSEDASGEVPPEPAIDMTVEAGEADSEAPRRRLVKWNEYDGPLTTARLGLGFILDFATFAQDEESEQQVEMPADVGVRDFRLVLGGRFKTERPLSWTVGYMYDGAADVWRVRKTGLYVGVPELSGRFFIGRCKEGYSLVKVMNGYQPWSMERSPAMDAFIPILADGVKYMGYYERPRIYISVGWFSDTLSEDEAFATYDHQSVVRLGWLPILSDQREELLHVAVMARDAEPDGGMLQVRSRPESNLSPYFVETGKFAADHVLGLGVEAYYRKGPWLFGSEYNWQDVTPANGGNALFQGGDVVATWLITGETRGYNAPGAYFKAVSPKRTVFEGGPGAWEAVLRCSWIDLDAGSFRGGKFWRLTPMVNWHMSDNLRLEFAYGYGVLDRFDLEGGAQFLQARIQMLL